MIFKLTFFFPLLCEAALRGDRICNDPEISDKCLSVCRLDYLTCRENCSSTTCESACSAVYTHCNNSCPCGAECPAGCVDCPDQNPFCEDDVSTATTTTTQMTPIAPSDVFILVITSVIDRSYLQSGDGTSQISATINATENNYARETTFALISGELHIFGGLSDGYKIARLDGCSLNELPVRLNERRRFGHAALSIENGQKALVCFGTDFGDTRISCEIFDGSSTVPTFAANRTHEFGGLGFFKNQPATVGCREEWHQKAETLSSTGWTPLPDHPLKISIHNLVGLENGAMLLLGGYDRRTFSGQTGIWQLKEEEWRRIGELSKPAYEGSAIYVSKYVYYFEGNNKAIYRLDLNENEELEDFQIIGIHPFNYLPVLFQTDNDYCT